MKNHLSFVVPFVMVLFGYLAYARFSGSKPQETAGPQQPQALQASMSQEQDLKAAGQTFAVLVGVEQYIYQRPLKYSVDDVQAFARQLASGTMGKVAPENMIILTDQQASTQNVLDAMNSIFAKAGPNDRVIFYFSGHGGPGMFCGYDGNISHQDLKNAFKNSKASHKICIADACRAGSMRQKGVTMEKSQKYLLQVLNDQEPNLKDATNTVIVLMSSRSFESSIEESSVGQGIFTYSLNKGLNGAADSNGDRKTTIQELYTFVRQQTQSLSQNQQTPICFGKFNKNYIFAKY